MVKQLHRKVVLMNFLVFHAPGHLQINGQESMFPVATVCSFRQNSSPSHLCLTCRFNFSRYSCCVGRLAGRASAIDGRLGFVSVPYGPAHCFPAVLWANPHFFIFRSWHLRTNAWLMLGWWGGGDEWGPWWCQRNRSEGWGCVCMWWG